MYNPNHSSYTPRNTNNNNHNSRDVLCTTSLGLQKVNKTIIGSVNLQLLQNNSNSNNKNDNNVKTIIEKITYEGGKNDNSNKIHNQEHYIIQNNEGLKRRMIHNNIQTQSKRSTVTLSSLALQQRSVAAAHDDSILISDSNSNVIEKNLFERSEVDGNLQHQQHYIIQNNEGLKSRMIDNNTQTQSIPSTVTLSSLALQQPSIPTAVTEAAHDDSILISDSNSNVIEKNLFERSGVDENLQHQHQQQQCQQHQLDYQQQQQHIHAQVRINNLNNNNNSKTNNFVFSKIELCKLMTITNFLLNKKDSMLEELKSLNDSLTIKYLNDIIDDNYKTKYEKAMTDLLKIDNQISQNLSKLEQYEVCIKKRNHLDIVNSESPLYEKCKQLSEQYMYDNIKLTNIDNNYNVDKSLKTSNFIEYDAIKNNFELMKKLTNIFVALSSIENNIDENNGTNSSNKNDVLVKIINELSNSIHPENVGTFERIVSKIEIIKKSISNCTKNSNEN